MTYAEMLAQAEKAGRTKQISIEIHRWETEDEVIVGRIIAVEKKASDTFDADYNQYLIDTDSGMVATIFGAGVDMLFKTQQPVGNIYSFQYKGKRKLDSGKIMNVFVVTAIPTIERKEK